jgi:hypothetical protein
MVCDDLRLAFRFRGRLLKAEVELGRAYPLEVQRLAKLGREFEIAATSTLPDDCSDDVLNDAIRKLWLDFRDRLIGQGYDSVDICEADGRVAMHVAMKAECILGFHEMTPAPCPR